MASPLQTEYLTRWRNYSDRRGHCLVKVELTDPSALTLRLSANEVATPDGVWEYALADAGPIVADGEFGAAGFKPATFSFSILNRRLSAQTSGTAVNLLASYVWYGATVTVYFWEESLSAWAKAAQQFKGKIIRCQIDGLVVRIQCRQEPNVVVEVPTLRITRENSPRAPQESMGQPRGGILYGSLLSPPAREPASRYGQFQQGLTSCYGGQRATAGIKVLVGRGNGGEKGLVLFAHHACKLFNSDVDGSTPFIDTAGRLCEIDPIAGDVVNSAADGTGFRIADITAAGVQPFDVFVPILATEIALVAANNGESPRSALDTINETGYAKLDYDAGQREITFRLAAIPTPGRAVRYTMVIGYHTSAGAANCLIEFGRDGGVPAPDVYGLAASTTPTVASCNVVTAGLLPADPYDLGQQFIRCYFNGVSAGEKFYIHYIGLVVKTIPNGDVVTPGKPYVGPADRQRELERRTSRFNGRVPWPGPHSRSPDTVQYTAPQAFFATLEGYADDGGGTYTGTGGALIELPPDVLRHFLVTYCNQAGADIETGFGAFGNFVDHRSAMLTWRQSYARLAAAINTFRQSTDVIDDFMSSALAWMFLSRFDNKWKAVAWKAGNPVTYDYVASVKARDFVNPEGPDLDQGIEDVANNIEVAYSWDDWQRRYVHETFVRPSSSQAGHYYRNLRDENTTVVASVSDRIDFTDAGGAHTANLTPAAYEPIALAQHLTTIMNAASASDYLNGWGTTIVTGYNDAIDFNDGVNKSVTIDPGTYATMEALCFALTGKLNGASNLWSVTYSRTTRKVTISRSAGTCTLRCNGGPNKLMSAYTVLGFSCTSDKTAAATYTASFEREEERFFLQCLTGTFALNCETGANGVNAATPRNCAALIGVDSVRDLAETLLESYLGHSPKNNRESRLATSVARYGTRRLLRVELPFVNDTDTARELRNRLVDLFAAPRARVSFSTERMPDMERGRVLEFNADLDEVKPYAGVGSNGSWAGKKFMVYRVIQHCGAPTFETEIEAVEIS